MSKRTTVSILLSVFFFQTNYSQTPPVEKSDKVIVLTTEKIDYQTRRIISEMSFSAIKLSNNHFGIRIDLQTRSGLKPPDIRLDTITLIGSMSVQALQHLTSDTSYFKSDGSLVRSSIHSFKPGYMQFLKEDLIKIISLSVNGKQLLLDVKSESQKRIRTMARESYF